MQKLKIYGLLYEVVIPYFQLLHIWTSLWDNISTSALASAWNIPGLGIDEETVDPDYVPF